MSEYVRGLTEARDLCFKHMMDFSLLTAGKIQELIDAVEPVPAPARPRGSQSAYELHAVRTVKGYTIQRTAPAPVIITRNGVRCDAFLSIAAARRRLAVLRAAEAGQ